MEVRRSATRGLRRHDSPRRSVGAHGMARRIVAITGDASPTQGKPQVCVASQRRDPASTAGEPSLSEVAGPIYTALSENGTSRPLIADFALGRRASWQIGVERRAA